MLEESTSDLLKMYPTMSTPIRCENGCGAVIEMGDSLRSYLRDARGDPKLICECCASEIGHMDEDVEEHEAAPVCRRPAKRQLR